MNPTSKNIQHILVGRQGKLKINDRGVSVELAPPYPDKSKLIRKIILVDRNQWLTGMIDGCDVTINSVVKDTSPGQSKGAYIVTVSHDSANCAKHRKKASEIKYYTIRKNVETIYNKLESSGIPTKLKYQDNQGEVYYPVNFLPEEMSKLFTELTMTMDENEFKSKLAANFERIKEAFKVGVVCIKLLLERDKKLEELKKNFIESHQKEIQNLEDLYRLSNNYWNISNALDFYIKNHNKVEWKISTSNLNSSVSEITFYYKELPDRDIDDSFWHTDDSWSGGAEYSPVSYNIKTNWPNFAPKVTSWNNLMSTKDLNMLKEEYKEYKELHKKYSKEYDEEKAKYKKEYEFFVDENTIRKEYKEKLSSLTDSFTVSKVS